MSRSTRRAWTRPARAASAVLVLAAALLAVPIRPIAAAADAPPDTFTVQNWTRFPLVTTQVRVNTDKASGQEQVWSRTFGQRFPYPGQIIQPGQVMFFDLSVEYNGPSGVVIPSSTTIDYTVGAGGPAIHVSRWQNGKIDVFHQNAFACTSDSPDWTCSHDASNAEVLSTTRHDTVVPQENSTLQLQLMNTLCQFGNPNVHCSFVPGTTDFTDTTLPWHPVGDDLYNYTDDISEHSWTQEWESGTSYSVGGSYSPVDIDVADVVKVEVKVTYDHDWGSSHSATVRNGVEVKPGYVGWIEAKIPAWQLTGDLRVGVGNDWWTLKDVTFTTAEPAAGGGSFNWSPFGQARQMTADEKSSPPPTS